MCGRRVNAQHEPAAAGEDWQWPQRTCMGAEGGGRMGVGGHQCMGGEDWQ